LFVDFSFSVLLRSFISWCSNTCRLF